MDSVNIQLAKATKELVSLKEELAEKGNALAAAKSAAAIIEANASTAAAAVKIANEIINLHDVIRLLRVELESLTKNL